jgi:hypothetical protein
MSRLERTRKKLDRKLTEMCIRIRMEVRVGERQLGSKSEK